MESDDDVLVVSGADDATKWSLLRGADFLINSSALESFSLVLFEAWAAGIPVLVNGCCETTRDTLPVRTVASGTEIIQSSKLL